VLLIFNCRILVPEELSDDPFGDIESLRDDWGGKDVEAESEVLQDRMSRIEEQSEVDDEEAELTSLSFDYRDCARHEWSGD
jgi:hypothetical protein